MSVHTADANHAKATRAGDGTLTAVMAAIRPFQVNIPEAELTDLRRRINATRLPEKEPVASLEA